MKLLFPARVNRDWAWWSELAYDGLGRRRIAKDYSWSGSAWSLTNEVRYVWDGMVVLQERDGANAVQVTYTRGLDLSGTRQGAGGIGGLLARTDASGTTFYHSDAGGNITAMTDGNGNVVARYLYDPFGNLLAKSGTMADANHYRFSSKEVHPTSGLYYYGFRFYEPNLQRWLNEDPIGEAGGINLFGFVRNDPLGGVDTLGLLCLKDFDPSLIWDKEVWTGIWSLLAGQNGNTKAPDQNSNWALRRSEGAPEGKIIDEQGNSYTGGQLLLAGAGTVTAIVVAEAVDAYNPLDEVSDLNKLRKCKQVSRKWPKHHPWPQYLGGLREQTLKKLPLSKHKEFHRELDRWKDGKYKRRRGAEYYEKMRPEDIIGDLREFYRTKYPEILADFEKAVSETLEALNR